MIVQQCSKRLIIFQKQTTVLQAAQCRFSSILILAEHSGGKIKDLNKNLIAGARNLQQPTDLIIFSKNTADLVQQACLLPNLNKIFHFQSNLFSDSNFENFTSALVNFLSLNKSYKYLIGPGSDFGRNILPRTSAMLGHTMISEVINFKTKNIYQRMVYAGDIVQTVESNEPLQILSLRCSAFKPDEIAANSEPQIEELKIETISSPHKIESKTKNLGQKLNKSTRPDLASAKIVVSGGRAFKSKDEFECVYQLADAMNAAVGASRAVVDSGIAPNDMQVGQTGKIVSPELYLAVGISGAVQHIAGMKDSKVIAAINNDPNAPIFDNADIGLVEDVKKAVPQLIGMVEQKKKK